MNVKLEKYGLGEEHKLFFSCLNQLKNQNKREFSFLATNINEEDFLSLLRRHRLLISVVNSPLFDALPVSLPSKKKMKRIALKKSSKSLLYAAEAVTIHKEMQKNGISGFFIKGPVSELQIFGKLGSRENIDLDLIVTHGISNQFIEMMGKLDYTPKGIHKGSQKNVNMGLKDIVFQDVIKKTLVEAHYRLFFNPSLDHKFQQLGLMKISDVSTPSVKLPCLDINSHFIYLCIHGSLHQWFRLFWLNDVAEVLHKGLIDDWVKLLEYARRMDAQRPVLLALKLSNIFFDTPIPTEIIDNLRQDKKLDWFVQRCIEAIMDPINETLFRRIRRLVYMFRLFPGINYKVESIKGALLRFTFQKRTKLGLKE